MDLKSAVKPFSPQTAKIKIESPAEAIIATTAGLRPSKIPWIIVKPLYL